MRAAPGTDRRRSGLRFAALALVLATCGGCGRREPPPPAGPDVVLITLESLRVDHVGAYGGASPARPQEPVTPRIDDFARTAVVYTDAHAVTSWTLASHASLFTGLYPSGHQTTGPRDRLDDSYSTLAELLAARGYQTAGVVSGPYLRRTHNLSQGFDYYDDELASLTSALAHDDVTNPGMLEALRHYLDEERDRGRAFFLFAYFWDPHFDFLPPPPYDETFRAADQEPFDVSGFDTNPEIHPGMSAGRRAHLLAQYAGELRWTDEYVGRFFDLLRERGLWDDALVILTADHGEEFFDHGEKGHKKNLYAETVHVPLIVRYPGQSEGRRDARLVSQVDLLPTILAVTGTPASAPLHGVSLLDPPPTDRSIFYELRSVWYSRRDERLEADEVNWRGIRDGRYKLVVRDEGSEGSPRRGLFDVSRDPREQEDLSDREVERSERLERRLRDGLQHLREDARRYRAGGPASLTPEEVERLRELGYFDD